MNNPEIQHTLIIKKGLDEQMVLLGENSFSIGRHSSNSWVIKSKLISRCHATILRIKSRENGEYSFWLIDGNEEGIISTNGLTVNGECCLMHELKSGDEIVLPEGTIIIYEIRLNSPKTTVEKNISTNHDQEVKIKTYPGEHKDNYSLNSRIYLENTMMLYLLVDKELEIMRSSHGIVSFIFIFYDLQKLKTISPKNYKKVFRLYQLIISKTSRDYHEFILSFESLEIVVLKNIEHPETAKIANKIVEEIHKTYNRFDFLKSENFIAGGYSQIPQKETNAKSLIEQVYRKLIKSTHNDPYTSFVDLNLLGLK